MIVSVPAITISIPSGTIKRSQNVQLLFENSNISIPSGTIKSFIQRNPKQFQFYISIPSGTIKSPSPPEVRLRARLFQFLLVRLKEAVTVVQRLTDQISIPSGTIKRCLYGSTRKHQEAPFQFLLVRLKDGIGFQDLITDQNFNSFWYD